MCSTKHSILKSLALSFLLFSFFHTVTASASPVADSCLRLYCGSLVDTLGGDCINYDSVRVDTCVLSSTYRQLFAKQWFYLRFDHYVINVPAAPADTVLEMSWTAIDTSYSALRAEFSALEAKYGTITLKKYAPSWADSTDAISNIFYLRFANYACIDSVMADLATFSNVAEYHYSGFPKYLQYIPNDRGMQPNLPITSLQPAGSDVTPWGFFWQKFYHKRGWQWNLYSINCPMAWEISQGNTGVVVADHDYLGTGELIINPDITMRTHSGGAGTPTGNWMLLDASVTTNNDPQFKGDGLIASTAGLTNSHLSVVLPIVVATSNNDNGTTPPSGGMVGVAPKTRGVALDWNIDVSTISSLDVDNKRDNVITPVDIVNYSYTGGTSGYESLTNAGIIQVAAAGNGRLSGTNPGAAFPSALVFSDPSNSSDGTKDVKILSVAALEDGLVRDDKCHSWWTPGGDGMFPHYTDNECFIRDWNFSPGTDKFNNNTNPTTRIAAKEQAHVDVVAPSGAILCPSTTDVTDPTEKARILSQKYNPNLYGTSMGSPTVAGVAALMTSVQKQLGESGRNVQKKAYDIITFTADKIPDVDNISSGLSKPSTFDYTEQTNDPLHRWWEQRMGFGKVNAYRAVAQTIPKKGDYEYTSSQTLAFDNSVKNENGYRLMHFGSWKDASNKVLDAGGNSLPGESYNNQGTTLLNSASGSPTVLTVGTSTGSKPDILAIDGIVSQTDATKHANKITTNGGLILATGMLQDVTLEGHVKVSDLIIDGSDDGLAGITSSFTGDVSTEIFGAVTLKNKAELNLNGLYRVAKVQPGGSIHLAGDKDLVVTNGAFLSLNSGSSVVCDNPARKIIIGNNSKLYIYHDVDVEVDGTVEVQSGGELFMDTNSVLRIKHFVIDKGGKLTVFRSGRIILTADGDNLCQGVLSLQGLYGSEINITAREGCDNPVGDDVVGTASITIQGDLTINPDPAEAWIKNTHFENVSVSVIDAIKYDYENNWWKANSSFVPSYGPFALVTPMFNITNTSNLAGLPTAITRAHIVNCWFHADASVATGVSGLYLERISAPGINLSVDRSVKVEGCIFDSMINGIWANVLGGLLVSGSTFNNNTLNLYGGSWGVAVGIYTYSSFPRVCSSLINGYGYGGFNLTDESQYFDNTISNSIFGTYGLNGIWGHFRHNSFTDNQIGVTADGMVDYLTTTNVGATSQYLALGRNTFDLFNPLLINAGSSDLQILNTGNIFVQCGYNNMNAAPPALHITANNPKTVNISFNNWRPAAAIRKTPNVATPGGPLNITLPAGPVCGDFQVNTSCYNGNISEAKANDNSISDIETYPDLVDFNYSTALNGLLDEHATPESRQEQARSLVTFATGITNDSIKLQTLNSLSSIFDSLTRTAIPASLSKDLYTFTGLIKEVAGNYNAAIDHFSNTATQPATALDSLSRQWHVLLDQAHLTKGASDSARNLYMRKVLIDLAANLPNRITSEDVNTTVPAGDLFQNVTVHHNSNSQVLNVKYELISSADVTVELYSILGERLYTSVATLQRPDENSMDIPLSSISSGIYFIRLSDGNGNVKTVKTSIAK